MTPPAELAECGPVLLARVIAGAGNSVRAEGWVPLAAEGVPGTSLTWALCRRAGCEVFRPGYPIMHTDVCRLAHARVVGFLLLEGLAGDAEVRVPEALGEWERWCRPGRLAVLAVADATAERLGLTGLRHLSCGYWGEGADAAERLADMRRHLAAAPCGGQTEAPGKGNIRL